MPVTESAPSPEPIRTPEAQKASEDLMLQIANGNFEESATNLPTNPTKVDQRSYDALYANHQDIRKRQQDEVYERIRQSKKDDSDFHETPEGMRNAHFIAWSQMEAVRLGSMYFQQKDNPQGQEALIKALAKLHLSVAVDQAGIPDVEAMTEQFYKKPSDSGGGPGEFYNAFCTGNSNKTLVETLTQQEMLLLQPFLVDMLGSKTAFDALLATRQTQDALDAQTSLPTTIRPVTTNEKPIVDFFKKGIGLSDTYPAPKLQAQKPTPDAPQSPKPPTPTIETIEDDKENKQLPSGVGLAESIGGRDEMEDAHVVERDLGRRQGQEFFAIYDGHRGRAVADAAAQMLHQYLTKALTEGKTPQEALQFAYAQTQQQIENGKIPGGATAITAFMEGDKIIIGNLGDARAVMVRSNGQVERLSRDMKANDPQEQEKVRQRGGVIRQGGIVGNDGYTYAVSGALGDNEVPGLQKEPDIKEVQRTPQDNWLILACDGIWDVIQDNEVSTLIKDATNAQEAAQKLVEEALKRGGRHSDNLSAIAVKLEATTQITQPPDSPAAGITDAFAKFAEGFSQAAIDRGKKYAARIQRDIQDQQSQNLKDDLAEYLLAIGLPYSPVQYNFS